MSHQKLVLNIIGMHCASCVAKIEKRLSRITGIKRADINLPLGTATIEYDQAIVNFIKIKNAIESLNYQVTTSSAEMARIQEEKYQTLKNKFLISLIFTLFIVIFSFYEYIPLFAVLNNDIVFKFLFFMTLPVLFWGGSQFFSGALSSFKPPDSFADMNTLVAVGTSSSFIYSSFSTFFPYFFTGLGQKAGVYYDTTAVIITLVLLGRLLETRSRRKAIESVKGLINLQAKKATVIKGKKEIYVPINIIKKHDIIIVKPGERIAVDGVVVSGETSVDESMISGESVPVDKKKGDKVIGGTVNRNGFIKIKALKVGKDSVLFRIISLVETAAGSKAQIQRLVDKIANIFVPIVIIIAVFTFLIWYFVFSSFGLAVLNFVAVLIIACPCALGLATPIGIIVGVGIAAKKGILIKNADSLEKCHKINTVVFDKTATLTYGTLKVMDIVPAKEYSKEHLLEITASLERKSEHPIAISIVKEAQKHVTKLLDVHKFKALSGFGIIGKIGKEEYMVGKLNFIKDRKNIKWVKSISAKFNKEGKVSICIADKKEIIGVISLADTLKENAKSTIEELKKLNIQPVLLTGDNKTIARKISKELGIKDFKAEVLPADKAKLVKNIQSKQKLVAMVGDGINDSPALAQADIGVALSTGTDIAMESSDVVLVKGDLTKFLDLIKISKRTMKIIKQNLFWAFIYNIIGIPIAAGAFYPAFQYTLNPMLASLFMALSSVSVVTNSLRIKR